MHLFMHWIRWISNLIPHCDKNTIVLHKFWYDVAREPMHLSTIPFNLNHYTKIAKSQPKWNVFHDNFEMIFVVLSSNISRTEWPIDEMANTRVTFVDYQEPLSFNLEVKHIKLWWAFRNETCFQVYIKSSQLTLSVMA